MAESAFETLRDVLPIGSSLADDGRLEIGGVAVTDITREYGTPVQIFDEAGLRQTIRRFVDGLAERWPNSQVLFASKSLPLFAMYSIAESEKLAVDVAGEGELLLALAAGVSPERLHLHGNAKTDAEIQLALEHRIGSIIVDGPDDIARIERFAPEGYRQRILIRVIPGVAADTHSSMMTGGRTSKFGVLPSQANEMIRDLEQHPSIHVEGVHLHIGSQILDAAPFALAVETLAAFPEMEAYDVGGGLGVAYNAAHEPPQIEEYLDTIVNAAKRVLPSEARLLIEPGRSIVGRSGVTAYDISTVKTTSKTFVAVNGGLADNVELYFVDEMSAIIADRAGLEPDTPVKVVGRQCESGDVFVRRGSLNAPEVGDVLVVPATGAYCYTMANNYNGALRLPVVFAANGTVRVAARRETRDEFMALHAPAREADWASLPSA